MRLRSRFKVLCGVMLMVIGVETGILLLAGPLPRAAYFTLAGISAALALAPVGLAIYWFRDERKREQQ